MQQRQTGPVSRWVCPRCDREFGRARQAHVCVPGGTVADSFAGAAPGQREAYDAVLATLRELGPVHEDAVGVGVFLKTDRALAQARPRARALALTIWLPHEASDPRMSRVLARQAGRVAQRLLVRSATDVDDQVRDWLTQAYLLATDPTD
jgi:hypothetical protein